jgi:hypothetical protein
MNHDRRSSRRNGFGTIVGGITSTISKGLDLIAIPTKARCDVYSSQSTYAQEQMQKADVSKRDRRYWTKQNNKAMNGLAQVHNKNSETFVGAIFAISFGLLIGNKFFRK